jgi:hypothetical protein
MSLVDFQRRMAADVTRPLNADFTMQADTEDGESVRELVERYVKPNDRLSPFDRLEIYNRQYWFRVIGAVAEDFSALQAVVGSSRFDKLVLAYLIEHPSTSFTLRNLGAKLPKWLEAHPEYCSRRHQLALDVARLEWAYVEAYDGASVPPWNEAEFASLNGESRLALQPHVQLLALGYPVDELVLAVHKGSPEVETASNAMAERRQAGRVRLPVMRRAATFLAVHRYENSVYYRRVDREAYLLLASLQAGSTVATALEAAFARSKLSDEQQAGKIQQIFAHAAELGWFCSQSISADEE